MTAGTIIPQTIVKRIKSQATWVASSNCFRPKSWEILVDPAIIKKKPKALPMPSSVISVATAERPCSPSFFDTQILLIIECYHVSVQSL